MKYAMVSLTAHRALFWDMVTETREMFYTKDARVYYPDIFGTRSYMIDTRLKNYLIGLIYVIFRK